MAKINKVMVGESLVGDGNEVAHIDLIIGPPRFGCRDGVLQRPDEQQGRPSRRFSPSSRRTSPASRTRSFTTRSPIKDARQAVQMFGPAQYGVAKAVQDSVAEGRDPGR